MSERTYNMDLTKATVIKRARSIKLTIPGFCGKLYDFQRTGISWLYFIQRGILADQCGLGKTIQALGLLQLLKSKNALRRALILVPAASIYQWRDETRRFTNLSVGIVRGTKSERVSIHMQQWDVLIANYEILHRDFEWFMDMRPDVVFLDEATAFKNPDTATANNVKLLTRQASRIYPMTATPIQNNLMDIHSIFESMHLGVFGGSIAFQDRYCMVERVMIPRRGRMIRVPKIMGYKRMDEFKEQAEPFFLRRRYADVGMQLPSLVVRQKWLDLTKLQQQLYDELTKKARSTYKRRLIKDFRVNLHYIQEVLDDAYTYTGKQEHMCSSKLDWLMGKLTGDLAGEKMVVFSRYKRTLVDFKRRLERAGIKYIEITGDIKDKQERYAYQQAFNRDPEIKVCLGTTALEMSINLQAARFVFFIDLMWNPARVEQVVGRIRRFGSQHSACCAVMLLTSTPFEERIIRLLARKQSLADFVFGERSDLFQSLGVEDLYSLVA